MSCTILTPQTGTIYDGGVGEFNVQQMKERKVGGLARVAIRTEVKSFTECTRATVLIVNTLLDCRPSVPSDVTIHASGGRPNLLDVFSFG